VTPFDPAALVAVLSAFYPTVDVATLAQARRARPGVFAGGALVGDGDRLQLPDGRVFLLIWQGAWTAVGDTPDPAAAGVWDANRIAGFFLTYGLVVPESVIQQWLGYWRLWGWKDPGYFLMRLSHAQELVDAGLATALPADPGGDAFALEDGPLAPIDDSVNFFGFGTAPTMESIVSDQLAPLDGSEPQLDTVQGTVAQFDPAGAGAALDDGTLEAAGAAHAGTVAAFTGDSIDDVAGATDGQRAGATDTRGTYDENPPPPVSVVDPGDPPDKGPGSANPLPPAA